MQHKAESRDSIPHHTRYSRRSKHYVEFMLDRKTHQAATKSYFHPRVLYLSQGSTIPQGFLLAREISHLPPHPVISSLQGWFSLDISILCWKSVMKVEAPRVLLRRRSLGSDIRWKFHSVLQNIKIKLLWVGASEDVLFLRHFCCCCFLWNFLLRRRPACWIGFCFPLLQQQDGL